MSIYLIPFKLQPWFCCIVQNGCIVLAMTLVLYHYGTVKHTVILLMRSHYFI